ncbi:hypothetical protein E4O05_09465 [Treponema sp. OMZ 787]|uniref:RHS repeat domain-containing protein n=1 Tax=Treponema sp. OMZ 787 TaxID=2563669 RepID=UPI0021FDBE9D|nr:RHS repeat-associated core domain-containing protein [Treponema sp. OMZ 787]UTC61762.1 hypothetical protein E4O05_09465 [Treponema sp. OMZ 787]
MKPKLCICSQPNYLIRTAIEAEILFAVCIIKKQALTGGKILAHEDKCSKKIRAVLVQQADRRSFEASAMPALVYFYIIMIVHKCQQSAAQRGVSTFELRVLPFGKTSGGKLLNLLSNSTDRTFENRRSRYKELGKKVPQAYRVYVEDSFLPCDAVDARIFSKEMTHTENQRDNDEQKTKRYYYHSDHLGSAQFVTDWRGKQYEHIEYTPYGELWIEETAPGIDKLPFRFTGKELDEETGLYYYGARYLDPKYSRWLSGDPALNDYIPKAPIDDEAKKHNENLPGLGGVFNVVNLHVYNYAGNNPVKYVDPDGDKILDVSTTLFQESGGKEPLGKSSLTIKGYGCVLTAYTRIGNAIGISEDITLLSANRTAKNNIFVGEDKNLLDRWNSGPKLVNRIGEGSGNMLKFDKSLTNLTLNEYGVALEEYKNSFDTYAVTIRLSSGHTVNMNTDGIIRDDNGNYMIKINNTSNLSTHNAWKPGGMDGDVIDKNIYIQRVDVFKVEFNGNFNKNILLPN